MEYFVVRLLGPLIDNQPDRYEVMSYKKILKNEGVELASEGFKHRDEALQRLKEIQNDDLINLKVK